MPLEVIKLENGLKISAPNAGAVEHVQIKLSEVLSTEKYIVMRQAGGILLECLTLLDYLRRYFLSSHLPLNLGRASCQWNVIALLWKRL